MAGALSRDAYLQALGSGLYVKGGSLRREGDDAWAVSVERSIPDIESDRTIRRTDRFVVVTTDRIFQSIGCQKHVSPSGRRCVVFSEEVAEIFEDGTRVARHEFPHGKIVEHGTIGGVSWSPDESQIAYVADNHKPAKTKEWGYDDFLHREDFGEKLEGVVEPCVFVLSLDSCRRASEPPSGMPAFGPSLAYVKFPRGLGITYCANRPLGVQVEGAEFYENASSPRWSRDGRLATIRSDFHTHDGPSFIVVGDWRSEPLFGVSMPTFGYANALRGSTPWMAKFPPLEWLGPGKLLGADDDGALLVHDQAPDNPGTVRLDALELPVGPISRVAVETTTEVLEVEVERGDAFLLRSKNRLQQQQPLVVFVHGGPHSVSRREYYAPWTFLATQGYGVLVVNYRGSIGFGDLNSLPGNIGEIDVCDVVSATRAALDQYPLDPDRVAVVGGSHGGFISAHLVARHPDLYKVAAMRNPVTNLVSMISATDIPDWVHVEGLGVVERTTRVLSSEDDVRELWARSPLTTVARVRAPTLVAVGLKDRRVPPSQGFEYYHALTATKRLLTYPEDDHAIDRPKSSADFWLNTLAWVNTHL
ncbi:hypothetical protein CTAYLR_004023 [Chrysophaeum taylorii]|uniref:Peptidase S9 prolyl oligopeptidase catalytic domain-containing protein n=1 Tax=Chrysophaeum taylorii TaxID=2483200 RepID=A0AAD7XHR4_9STRA|nr:hypothetical protein CTAYLR_004023 [Chrysophaeum taylorii]